MNTASPDSTAHRRHAHGPSKSACFVTHAPFAPPRPSHFAPWVATLASDGIDYAVDDSGDRPVIWVPLHLEDRARAELEAYETANKDWPKHPQNHAHDSSALFNDMGICTFLVFEAALYRFFLFVENSLHRASWKEAGLWDIALVRESNQWWRCITALTLHADAAHVLSNMLWGFIFGSLTSARIGTGFALLLMLLSGTLGNATMAFVGSFPHQSLGASTMVFGLLGVLTSLHTRETWSRREDGRGIIRLLPWVPLAFGIAMALVSGGAPGSDALAHACGFAWGLVLGAVIAACKSLIASTTAQIIAALASLGAFFLAWTVA